MALYLPLVTALLAGIGLLGGGIALAVAVVTVVLVLVVAIRYGHLISAALSAKDPEALLLGVLGLTLLVAGRRGEAPGVRRGRGVPGRHRPVRAGGAPRHRAALPAAGPLRRRLLRLLRAGHRPRDMPPVLLPALGAGRGDDGDEDAHRLPGRPPGRDRASPAGWRAGLALMPRGEFSIVIAGLAVAAGTVEPRLAALATAYVLITVVTGPMLARLPDTRGSSSGCAAARSTKPPSRARRPCPPLRPATGQRRRGQRICRQTGPAGCRIAPRQVFRCSGRPRYRFAPAARVRGWPVPPRARAEGWPVSVQESTFHGFANPVDPSPAELRAWAYQPIRCR